MERCNLYNYADDNSIIYSFPDIETVILNLKHDCQNAIQWFTNNGMKANRNKFQFMVISSEQMEPQNIELHDGVSIISELNVKILGVVIDDRLNFDEHVSMCCTKAARQLNVLARISKYLDFKSKTIMSILTTRIKCIVSEVFKSLYKLNALCLHDMFKINKTSYEVRVTNQNNHWEGLQIMACVHSLILALDYGTC